MVRQEQMRKDSLMTQNQSLVTGSQVNKWKASPVPPSDVPSSVNNRDNKDPAMVNAKAMIAVNAL